MFVNRLPATDTSVIDQYVNAFEGSHCLLDKVVDIVLIGNISLHRQRLAAACLIELIGQPTDGIRPAATKHDIGAFFSQSPGNALANPGPSTSYNCRLSFKCHAFLPHPLAARALYQFNTAQPFPEEARSGRSCRPNDKGPVYPPRSSLPQRPIPPSIWRPAFSDSPLS